MPGYEDALRGLNQNQRRAVETIDGPVLVIAGPGTGKTQLLTTRIAHILATTDTLPQNILCLTFTDSAAATMQERLGNMIGQGAYDVTISTYHAFGSELIRRFPDYFAADADLRPADDLAIDRILRAIVARLPFSNPLKYADNYLRDIKGLISDAKRALLAPDDLRAVAKANLTFIEAVNPLVADALADVARIDKKSIPKFTELLQTVRAGNLVEVTQPKRSRKSAAETLGSDDDFTRVSGHHEQNTSKQSLPAQFIESLEEAVSTAEESGKTTSLTAWKNKWLAKDAEGRFIADGAKANQKLLAAADVYQSYLLELETNSLFDYDDMILRAVRALETNADLRYTLQEQYQYVLLDEFQDTNGAQLRIVELLTDNPVNEGRPNVLAVGDDDQAIYAFQGANYSHMLQFQQMYRDVLVVPLTQNYRSHTDVLHTARGIAEQIEERLHHHFPQIEKDLTAENTKLPPDSVLERRDAESDIMQYAWAARRIKKLIEQGVPPSEIAVLAPQHKYLEPLVPFLQQLGVPVRYEKRENVLDDPAINQLLRMSELSLALAAGNQGAANALWAEVLSFNFWELPTSLIWQLSWQATDDDRNWTDELLTDDRLKPIALFFIRLSFLSSAESLENMLDYLIGAQPLDLAEPGYSEFTSPYYKHYFGDLENLQPGSEDEQENFWTLLTNLIVLRSRLREYKKEDDQHLGLKDFIEFVEAHRAAELKILNTSPYASGTDAVQLMTAFKSKGMEFAAVFVLAVNNEAWGSSSRSQSSRISLPPNLQYIRYAGATEDERLRLFYVAITRAKTQLYLLSYRQNYAGKRFTRLKYLEETTDELGVAHSPLLPAGKQIVRPAEDGTPAPTTELAAYWQRRHETALTSDEMRALLKERLGHFQLSPTHLADFTNLVHCGPQGFFMRTVLRFPQGQRADLLYGNTMHETLEWIHNITKQEGQPPVSAAVFKTFEKRLRMKALSSDELTLYLERGLGALKAYLSQRLQTVAPTNVVEYNFRSEGVFAGAAHLTGKIDKLIIDRQAKTITIVDYKTGRGFSRWSREVKLHNNRMQLYFYKMLVEGSHTFAGYRVTDGYLEFVEPDEDGKIHELHVDFDASEQERISQLTEAVWERIMTLDLPETDSYSADLAGIEAFEADLIGRQSRLL
jgi:DNA helicase-2/ATP-dependent DNA helicase PcrA